MTPEDRTIIQDIVDAIKALGDNIPKEKQAYILGYAEGVAGMAERLQQQGPASA